MDAKLFLRLISAVVVVAAIVLFIVVCGCVMLFAPVDFSGDSKQLVTVTPTSNKTIDTVWHAPDSLDVPAGPEGDIIRYGRELIAHTSVYLGPNGKVSQTTNGLNCQNCHLASGTKVFGNNYAAVYSTYPQVRSRSGTLVSIEERVNGCLERSLNGQRLKDDSREMIAIKEYFKWVGRGVDKGSRPNGAGIWPIPLLDRAADPEKGELVYVNACARCHGADGQGQLMPDGNQYLYPPLWGDHSYNTAAGLYRLSKFAGYVKVNMPFGVEYDRPELSDEDAWDVAAYVNSMPRPHKSFSGDWPDLKKKPFDHPFGPYADSFSETQHKYGPFKPIKLAASATN